MKKLTSSSGYDVIITLGAIIRGETPHFDIIAHCCSTEIARINTDTLVPVIFGVLAVDTMEQAMDRSGDEGNNKGSEAAQAAIKMANLMKTMT